MHYLLFNINTENCLGQMSQPEIISVCSEQVPQTTISQTSSALSIDDILMFALAGTLGISLIIIAVLILVICVLVKKKKSKYVNQNYFVLFCEFKITMIFLVILFM